MGAVLTSTKLFHSIQIYEHTFWGKLRIHIWRWDNGGGGGKRLRNRSEMTLDCFLGEGPVRYPWHDPGTGFRQRAVDGVRAMSNSLLCITICSILSSSCDRHYENPLSNVAQSKKHLVGCGSPCPVWPSWVPQDSAPRTAA
jgi:hypothetical protein